MQETIVPAVAPEVFDGRALRQPSAPGGTYPLGSPASGPPGPAQAPPQLLASRQWLLWRESPSPVPGKKPRKVPHYVSGPERQGTLDTPEDLALLSTHAEAVRQYERLPGVYAGLGFALSNGWQGIDLDDVPQNRLSDLANELPGYVERSPSGNGCHAIGYGRPFNTLGSNGSGIEAYAGGRFFTFTGDVIRSAPPCDLFDYVEQRLTPRHGSARMPTAGASAVYVDPKTVTELRSALNHMPSDDRSLWVSVGMALKELGETGCGLWLDWSQKSVKYEAPEAARVWDSLRPQGTGYQAVFAEAQRQGWVNPASSAAQIAAVAAPAELPNGIELLRAHAVNLTADATPTRYVWSGYMPEGELTILAGHGGAGKSMLALEAVCHLAAGRAFLGQTVAYGRVLFYSAEDPPGRIRLRVRSICFAFSLDLRQVQQNLVVIDATEFDELYGERFEQIPYGEDRVYMNRTTGVTPAYQRLSAMVTTCDPVAVVVDGASDTFDGDEIKRRQVRGFIRALVSLHARRRMSVLLLMHVNRETAKGRADGDDMGYSGSSQWHNSARSRLYLRKKDGQLELLHMKHQDGEPLPPVALLRAKETGVLFPPPIFGGALAPGAPTPNKPNHTALIVNLLEEMHRKLEWASPSQNSPRSAYNTLKGHPSFPEGLDSGATQKLVMQAESEGLLYREEFTDGNRNKRTQWRVKR